MVQISIVGRKTNLCSALLLLTCFVFCGCNNWNKEDSGQRNVISTDRSSNLVELEEFLSYIELNSHQDVGISGRFEIVEDSGIEFTNLLDLSEFKDLAENGSGVACADYDQDGNVDVYLTSTDGQNRMFRGLGDFKFQDVTDDLNLHGTVDGKNAHCSGASFADVDDDGDLDLFVCNFSSRNLLYLNQNDGTFKESAAEAGLAYSGASKIGTFCDYDRDGDLDLYLLTNQDEKPYAKGKMVQYGDQMQVAPGFEHLYVVIDGHVVRAGESDILYENNGKGVFRDVSKKSGIAGFEIGLSATWFDFDGDHWLDLYVANDFHGPDKLYSNNRDGTFTNIIGEATNHSTWFSMGASSGDLNNDGFEDLMVADMSAAGHYKQKVNMGNMSDSGWFLSYGHPRQYMRNSLFINTGAGRFLESAYMSHLDSTDWTWAVKFADLDNDGALDIYVTNGNARNLSDSDLVGETKRKMQSVSREEADTLKSKLPSIEEANLAFRNKGDLQFESVGKDWNLDLTGVSHSAAMADLDRDGDLDIVVNNLNKPATVYRNTTVDGNRLLVDLRGAESNYFGFGAKIEIWSNEQYQMRRITPVTGYVSSDDPVAHFGVADWTQVDRLCVTWPGGRQQEFENLPLNRFYRITENSNSTSEHSSNKDGPSEPLFEEIAGSNGLRFGNQEIEFNDYVREPLLPYKLSRLGPGVGWGDVNSDGFMDVFIGGPNPRSGTLFLNQLGKRFVAKSGPWEKDFVQEDMGAVFFDSDGDGDEDLYIVSGGNQRPADDDIYQDRLYINDGSGDFAIAAKGTLPELTDSGSCVVPCDFDRDGDLDLFVGSRSIPVKYPLTPSSRLLRNVEGKFVDCTDEVSDSLRTIGMVNSAIWSDYNNDGWVDLLLAIDWGPVAVFENKQGMLVDSTRPQGLAETLGWWHGLGAGDFDNDGDTDYIATNQGLNTKYHCSPEKPHRLYYEDFDGNGTLDLVEAEFEGDVEFPMRGRSCSSRCMPFVAEKFETFHEFAMAPVDDIYGLDERKSPHMTVNELRSVVIWNNGDDGFEIQPLPQLAQISPGFGVAVSDYNNDGNLDTIISQNFFGAQPETGYMDGGLSLLLLGNGKRDFRAVWPKESGIAVSDDAMVLTLSDFDRDGDLDPFFVSNRGSARLFQNRSSDNEKRVTIKLIGDDANRRATGAQLEISGSSWEKKFEVTDASGYIGNSRRQFTLPLKLAKEVEELIVTWPDGTVRKLMPDINGSELIIEKQTTSNP